MPEYKVIKAPIELKPHINSDRLELVKVGEYQSVVRKGLHREGEMAIFVPEKSLLPEHLQGPYRNYLKGKQRNRVGTTVLRGELSQGVIIPLKLGDPENRLPVGVDISAALGIDKYIPPIPVELSGKTEPIMELDIAPKHDCLSLGAHASEFVPGEWVNVYEKIHGTQGIFIRSPGGRVQVSSKGHYASGLCYSSDNENNIYWRAAKASGLFEWLERTFPDSTVICFGEVVPVQGDRFKYGYDSHHPGVILFRLVVDGVEVPPDEAEQLTLKSDVEWVKAVYKGAFDRLHLSCLGSEMRSSKYPRTTPEGIVIVPRQPRTTALGYPLYLKVISSLYAKKVDSSEVIS